MRRRRAGCAPPSGLNQKIRTPTTFWPRCISSKGNLEAALKYWNRVGKPAVEDVREDPELRIDPALLDSAFAFSPAATLRLPQFLDTNARVHGLGVFPQYKFDLNARDDGKFDVVFRARELNGFGKAYGRSCFLFFRGIPFQGVEPGYYNWRGQAIDFESLFRWDAQKRRIFAQLSGPWEWRSEIPLGSPNRFAQRELGGAQRLCRAGAGAGQLQYAHGSGGLRVRRLMPAGGWSWMAGGAVSHRDFRNAAPDTALTPAMLDAGYELTQQARMTDVLWRVPERHFLVTAGAGSTAARLWSPHAEAFEKFTGTVGWNWFPQPQGDDYAMRQSLRAGRIFGQAPLDELFHPGTGTG